MSKWDEFKKSLGDLADKTVNATRELTDTASLKIKIANKEAERDLEYKNLGKLAYTKLCQLDDGEDLTEKISESLGKLDRIQKELEELLEADEMRKEAKEAQKQAKKAENEQKKEAKSEDGDELDLSVMEQFNEARTVADEEYEKAKAAAEDAKSAD